MLNSPSRPGVTASDKRPVHSGARAAAFLYTAPQQIFPQFTRYFALRDNLQYETICTTRHFALRDTLQYEILCTTRYFALRDTLHYEIARAVRCGEARRLNRLKAFSVSSSIEDSRYKRASTALISSDYKPPQCRNFMRLKAHSERPLILTNKMDDPDSYGCTDLLRVFKGWQVPKPDIKSFQTLGTQKYQEADSSLGSSAPRGGELLETVNYMYRELLKTDAGRLWIALPDDIRCIEDRIRFGAGVRGLLLGGGRCGGDGWCCLLR
ncbi:hypothetical protein J6590_060233 [Homalodisca vitripennis]|nr:hypothetical protein J6590_060233 [Homalodisca vitripennis]